MEILGFITVERITGEALSTALLSWLEEHECVEDKAMMVLRVCLPVVLVFRQEFAKFAPSPCTLTVKVIVKACSVPHIRNANSGIAKFFTNCQRFLLKKCVEHVGFRG